jgi:hypothetical protein
MLLSNVCSDLVMINQLGDSYKLQKSNSAVLTWELKRLLYNDNSAMYLP